MQATTRVSTRLFASRSVACAPGWMLTTSRRAATIQFVFRSPRAATFLPLSNAKPSSRTRARPRRRPIAVKYPSRRWVAVASVAFFLALLALGYWYFRSAAGTPPRSLAVLPFVSLAADTESKYFSEGLSDELTNALGKLEGLRVVAWTSALQFQGKNEDVRNIGKKLDVEAVLEGSVQRLRGNVRVIARLDRAKDGTELWSDTFEGDSSDLLAIQRQIARSIAGALRTKFNRSTPPEETRPPRRTKPPISHTSPAATSGIAQRETQFTKASCISGRPSRGPWLCGCVRRACRFARHAS